jgi:predicted protein tyrosine phosphatase
MGRSMCEKYCTQRHERTSIIISIKSSWDRVLPNIYISEENNVQGILRLTFDDLEYEDDAKYCMQYQDGYLIAGFVRSWEGVDSIIAHCDGGISRSAGVMAAIMRVNEGSDHPVFDNKNKHPNMTSYLRTLKGFGYI